MAGTLEPIEERECWRLLREHAVKVGRVAIDRPSVMVLPVNYAVDEQRIVFRTAEGSLLDLSPDGEPVTFEVDDVDGSWQGGWSVLVVGRAGRITDEADVARLRELEVEPWAPVGRVRYVRINPEQVSGRRIVPSFLDPID